MSRQWRETMSIQELERRWRSEQENEKILAELLRLYERSNLELPVELLASSPRWRMLSNFAANFYEEPINEESGNLGEEIRAKELELECSLPGALKEWYRLVGKRLDSCGRSEPAKLSYLELIVNDVHIQEARSRTGALIEDTVTLEIYSEALSHWVAVIHREDFGEKDPAVVIYDRMAYPDLDVCEPRRIEKLSEFLTGMMFEEILAVASGGAGVGALGLLRNGLRAGHDESQPSTLKAGYEQCFDFEWGLWRVGEECFYSDRETLFSLSSTSCLRWICSSEKAYERLKALGSLEEEGTYVLLFQWPEMSTNRGQPHRRKIDEAWVFVELSLYESSQRQMWADDRYQIQSSHPKEDFEAAKMTLLAEMPELLQGLEVAYRPLNRGHWEVLWPLNLERFTRREREGDDIPF